MAKVHNGVNDFVLFPRDQPYLDTFDLGLGESFNSLQYIRETASNMHQHGHFSDQASTSYDSYPPVSTYSSTSSIYYGAPSVTFDAPKGGIGQSLQRHTPSGPPSPSVSQAFDHPPSTLSSASGASAQSTASSADGSPYASATHHLPYQDKWPEPLHGLGIGPEIVNSEGYGHDTYPMTSLDNDLMLGDSKFANYVGEYGKNFSPLFPMSHKIASSISSGSASQTFLQAFSSPPMALDTTASTRDATIDSILEEANTRIQRPSHLISPLSATSSAGSFTNLTSKHKNKNEPTERYRSFKSPITPASAVPFFPPRTASPVSSEGASCTHPVAASEDIRPQIGSQHSSSRFHPSSRTTPPPSSHGQDLYDRSLNPFFSQSSGRFVAPLESSCWFSLLSPFEKNKDDLCLLYFFSFSTIETI